VWNCSHHGGGDRLADCGGCQPGRGGEDCDLWDAETLSTGEEQRVALHYTSSFAKVAACQESDSSICKCMCTIAPHKYMCKIHRPPLPLAVCHAADGNSSMCAT
jgi:hypothetical protein